MLPENEKETLKDLDSQSIKASKKPKTTKQKWRFLTRVSKFNKKEQMLALLASRPNEVISRQEIADHLSENPATINSLRGMRHQLNKEYEGQGLNGKLIETVASEGHGMICIDLNDLTIARNAITDNNPFAFLGVHPTHKHVSRKC